MSHLHVPHDSTLESYRKLSSFNIEELVKFLFSEEYLNFQKELHEEIQKYPILQPNIDLSDLSVEEQKRLTIKKVFVWNQIRLKFKHLIAKPYYLPNWMHLIDQLDKCISVQGTVAFSMFPSTVFNLGTERHRSFIKDSHSTKILGAFCLTEVGHGSNTKLIQTTATYDKDTKEFIINTPNFKAAKCWIGNIGKLATHAVVYAQLITPDKKAHGLHVFVVPIRDLKTHLPFPRITIADLGEKIGLLGVDNGLMMFDNYRIPKENLLNKLGDVTDDGKYVRNRKDMKKHQSASFNVLSHGRLSIIIGSYVFQVHALTIALRYAAVRKQFGPNNSEEWPILEYQSHQYRLLPYLASAYTAILFTNYLVIQRDAMNDTNNQVLTEVHAIVSTGKPYFSAIAQSAIQKCREACAGIGYLSVSGLGKIRNDNDANVTFEGDNNILIQQTSNWLLRFWPMILSKNDVTSPLGSLEVLSNALEVLQLKFEPIPLNEFYKPQSVYKYYQWLVCYLLKTSYERCQYLETTTDSSQFWVKNNSQIFYLKNLSIAYLESFVFQKTFQLVDTAQNNSVKDVLNTLLSLYAMWCLQKHISYFYEGGYTDNPLFSKFIEDSILLLCKDLKKEVISLLDAISPLDDSMNSILGHSDGQVYSRLLHAVMQNPNAFSNATWLINVNSKL